MFLRKTTASLETTPGNSADFSISLMWHDKDGNVRRLNGRCRNLSPEGATIESRDRVPKGTLVLVTSDEHGRMGLATVRAIEREKMTCLVELAFGAGRGEPARQKAIAQVLASGSTSQSPQAV
jgi:hypothetical protein